MGALRTFGVFGNAYESGRVHPCSFRKVLSQSIPAGWWHDLSMSSGSPLPNYYASAPLEAAQLLSTRGIWHGTDQAPATKYLAQLELTSTVNLLGGPYRLCDYLLYYPFVDADTTDLQVMDNTTSSLSRYVDGAGVRVMAVMQAPATVLSAAFTFDYVNQDGVIRTSPIQGTSSGTFGGIGNLYTSAQVGTVNSPGGPFLKLASGDTGVRSIETVSFTVPSGGLIALVLVKPLVDLAAREINNPVEIIFGRDRMPVPIVDGAYLNFIVLSQSGVSASTLGGTAQFIWSD